MIYLFYHNPTPSYIHETRVQSDVLCLCCTAYKQKEGRGKQAACCQILPSLTYHTCVKGSTRIREPLWSRPYRIVKMSNVHIDTQAYLQRHKLFSEILLILCCVIGLILTLPQGDDTSLRVWFTWAAFPWTHYFSVVKLSRWVRWQALSLWEHHCQASAHLICSFDTDTI